MTATRVAIHQPNLFPWLGFFHKMRSVDVFVLLDTVPFVRRGVQHRVKIKTPQGPVWLTVPVLKKGRYAEITNEVQVDRSRPWQREHLETIRHNYVKAPCYPELSAELSRLYAGEPDRLVDFTLPGIDLLRRRLEIETPLRVSSELPTTDLHSSQLLATIVAAVGGDTYVSGPTGPSYMDEQVFRDHGVSIEYTSFAPFSYPQRGGAFVEGLSSLDLVLNVPEAATLLRDLGNGLD